MQNNFINSHSVAGCGSGDYRCNNHVSPDSNIVDWSRPVTRCLAGHYAEVSSNCPIYNKQTLTDSLWVELPKYAKQFSVAGIYKVHPTSADLEPCSPKCAIKHKNIWVRIPINLVDVCPGQKIYKIELKHEFTLENMALYFSYIIQDDNPDKPYVYMNR